VTEGRTCYRKKNEISSVDADFVTVATNGLAAAWLHG